MPELSQQQTRKLRKQGLSQSIIGLKVYWVRKVYLKPVSQPNLSLNIEISSGELEVFQLALRSFCTEVSYIECNTTKNQFKNVIPKDIFVPLEDFEIDLMTVLKVIDHQLRTNIFLCKLIIDLEFIKGLRYFASHWS